MRYLRLPDREELHAWTPALASRGDMVEVIVDGQKGEVPPVVAPVTDVPLPFDPLPESPETPGPFHLKYVGYGRYQICDRLGNKMLDKAILEIDAEAKLAELNA